MSGPQFTRGPWGVRPDIGAPAGCLKIAHPDWPRGRTDALIAAVYGYKHEQEANARLIAAAPDLYAALADLEQSVRDLSEQSDEGVLDYIRLLRRGHGMFPRMEAARSALARARGEVAS
jgi:hypothetical protein